MIKFKKIFKKIVRPFELFYYNISWGMRLNRLDKNLDILLIYLKSVKIELIQLNEYNCIIKFTDNSELTFWTANRWYGFMNSGQMNFSNGKSISWSSKSPSYEVLHEYKKLIKKHEKSTKVDFYEYLPIKLLRKEKLKKIKL